jgi:hypothetical protein
LEAKRMMVRVGFEELVLFFGKLLNGFWQGVVG